MDFVLFLYQILMERRSSFFKYGFSISLLQSHKRRERTSINTHQLFDSARESLRLKFIVARKEEIICTGPTSHPLLLARGPGRRGKLREKGCSRGSPRTNLSRVKELLLITGLIYSLNIRESCRS